MENQNSVCFISRINQISPIEGADKIELAQTEGWPSIVQKGIHKVGDLVLCLTTDAVIPDELAEKWGCKQYLRKGNRIRTVKLRKEFSQCILIPIFDLPIGYGRYFEGEDLTDFLNIYKYEPPVREEVLPGGKKHKYHENPHFPIYYKFPNQKNVPNMFSEYSDVVITRKIHGTNARFAFCKKSKATIIDWFKKNIFGNKWAGYEFIIGSHRVEKGSDSQGFYSINHWFNIAKKYSIKKKLTEYIKKTCTPDYIGSGFILYGEIYGPGIQGEKYTYGLKETAFAAFDIEINGKYTTDMEFRSLCNKLQLPTVEYLHKGFWSKELQDNLVNQNIKDTNIPEEGVVVKSIFGEREKISKVINPNYLIFAEKFEIPDSH